MRTWTIRSAGMRLTSDYFGRLTRAIADVADATAQGRLVAVTEGGYDLAGLADEPTRVDRRACR